MDTPAARPRYPRNDILPQLEAPLISYMLPHLTAAGIAAARGCCKAFQLAIDNAPYDTLKLALSSLLPASLGQPISIPTMPALQAALKSHAASIACLRTGVFQRKQVLPLQGGSQCSDGQVHWAPSLMHASPASNGDMLHFSTASAHQLATADFGCCDATWQAWLPNDFLLCQSPHWLSGGHYSCLFTQHPTSRPYPSSAASGLTSSKDLVSPSGSSILVWDGGHVSSADFAMMSLPSLTVQYMISWPFCGGHRRLPEGAATGVVAVPQGVFADEAAWSCTGAHFAVLWGKHSCLWQVGSPNAVHLTIHDAHDGACSCIVDLQLAFGCGCDSDPSMSWNPARSEVLVSCCRPAQAACSVTNIVEPDGTCASLPLHTSFDYLSAHWAPCGRYVGCVQVGSSVQGSIWDAQTLQKIFSWASSIEYGIGDARIACHRLVAWAQQGCMCCIAEAPMVVCLPADGIRSVVHSIPLHIVTDDDSDCKMCSEMQYFFSPCGSVLLGIAQTAQMDMLSASVSNEQHDAINQRVRESHHRDLATFGVWHATIDAKAAVCNLHLVGEIEDAFNRCHDQVPGQASQARLPSCIAWHPSAAQCMYAMADVQGSVSLVNRCGARIVSLLQLASPTQPPVTVDWRPDGGLLLIGHESAVTLLEYYR